MNPTKINNIDVEYNYINHLDPNIFNNYSYTIVDNVINISGNGSQTSFTDFFGNSVIDTTQWQPVNNSLHHTGSIKKSYPNLKEMNELRYPRHHATATNKHHPGTAPRRTEVPNSIFDFKFPIFHAPYAINHLPFKVYALCFTLYFLLVTL